MSATVTESGMQTSENSQMLLIATPVDTVLSALEQSRFDWRTVTGIANDTGLPFVEVTRILNDDLATCIVRSYDRDNPDDYLYATRKRYNQLRGFWHSFLSVVCDRIR